MPVFKYRTFDQARKALWNFHPDGIYFRQVAELWDTADRLCPVRYPQGIFKYRNIEEANKQREGWEIANAKRINAQSHRPHKLLPCRKPKLSDQGPQPK